LESEEPTEQMRRCRSAVELFPPTRRSDHRQKLLLSPKDEQSPVKVSRLGVWRTWEPAALEARVGLHPSRTCSRPIKPARVAFSRVTSAGSPRNSSGAAVTPRNENSGSDNRNKQWPKSMATRSSFGLGGKKSRRGDIAQAMLHRWTWRTSQKGTRLTLRRNTASFVTKEEEKKSRTSLSGTEGQKPGQPLERPVSASAPTVGLVARVARKPSCVAVAARTRRPVPGAASTCPSMKREAGTIARHAGPGREPHSLRGAGLPNIGLSLHSPSGTARIRSAPGEKMQGLPRRCARRDARTPRDKEAAHEEFSVALPVKQRLAGFEKGAENEQVGAASHAVRAAVL
ncbi:hypothetical protein P4O66_006862, partial [Electrophorus voltai]